MYIAKTKYSLDNNIEPKELLETAKENGIKTLIVADEGTYGWLELEKHNRKFQLNLIYALRKERNGVRMIWIPRGDALKNVAAIENAYRNQTLNQLNGKNFFVILDPNHKAKKEVIQKELDSLKWLKQKVERVYILDKGDANTKVLKDKSGVATISFKEVMYLNPSERDVSIMRKAIKEGQLIEDDGLSFMVPEKFLENMFGKFECNRTKRFLAEIQQELIVEGHKGYQEKRMEYWNLKEIEETPIPANWERFFGRVIKIPQSEREQKQIALLCTKAGKGFNERYQHSTEKEYAYAINHLKYELSVIVEKGFYTYFLMVEDFIRYCRVNNIRVNRGRGSVVGSILAYCLKITDIDPVQYELKFERFLNPYRMNKPDIDIDLPSSKTEELYKYAQEKYGKESVSKIVTFNTFGPYSAIQSVKNIFKIKDKIETWFPKGLKDIDAFLKTDKGALVRDRLEENGYLHILQYISGIAKLPQALSVHPAGVLISQELNELPLIEKDGELVLTFTKQDDQIERLGVTKFDFLKLSTLDILEETEKWVQKSGQQVKQLDFQDAKTFDLIKKGSTVGVFQLSSRGMRQTCSAIRPNSIEELMDISALFRPGPMSEIPRYVENKKKGYWEFEGLAPDSVEFKDIVPILNKTHGIITYQEQIMDIASVWAGYSLGEADLLRRAVSGKKESIMVKEKENFVKRSLANGRGQKVTEYIFGLIEKFAQYGFNRSHAAGYANLSFETATMKVHHPVEFMTASLNDAIKGKRDRDKILMLFSEVERMGIPLLRPDIDESEALFTPTANGGIRVGLAAIAGIGVAQAIKVKELIAKGEASLEKRLEELKSFKGKTMDLLVRAGALDSYGERMDIWNGLKVKKQQPNNVENTLSLYLEWENDLLGTSFSVSLLTTDLNQDEYFVETITKRNDKNGREMAFIKIVSKEGRKEIVVFHNIWAPLKNKVVEGSILEQAVVDGRIAKFIKVKE